MVTKTQSRSSKLSKADAGVLANAIQTVLSDKDKDALKVAAEHGTVSPPDPTKAKGNKGGKGKIKGVTVNYAGMGQRDAKLVDVATEEAGKAVIDVLTQMGRLFRPMGFGAKDKFSEAAETYFDGWRKYRDSIPEKRQRSMNPRISEARRVLRAYITQGTEKTEKILFDKGLGWHQRIAALPKQGNRGRQKDTTTATPTVATLASVEDATKRIELVKSLPQAAFGELATGLTDDQIPMVLKALSIRMTASKNKGLKALGGLIGKEIAALEVKETKQQELKSA